MSTLLTLSALARPHKDGGPTIGAPRRAARAGQIPVTMIGNRYYVSETTRDRWLAGERLVPKDEPKA